MNNSKNNTRKRILFVSTLIALVFSAQSNVILNGATFPLTSLGNIGDFYMNTATNVLFGVKDITVSGAPIASDAVLRSGGGTPPPLQRSGTSKTKLKGLRTSTIPSQGSGSADPPPPQDGGSGSADPPADESTTGGADGSSAFEVWQAIAGNEEKTLTDYLADIKGEQGETGPTGSQGNSSFEVWQSISGNETKTLTEYLADIKGVQGEVGIQGAQGSIGPTGIQGLAGVDGSVGPTGIQGIQGEEGVQGITGAQGDKGDIGLVGSSSFEVWQAISGNEAKTLTDYQADIKGEVGVQGEQGLIGATGAAGTDGLDATNSPKDCPLGYVSVNDNYCIQADENTPSNWFDAVVTCTTQNAQLCTWANWYGAVATQPLLANTTNNWEWLDDGGDDDSNYAKVAGNGNAKSHNSEEMETAQAYRCCFPR